MDARRRDRTRGSWIAHSWRSTPMSSQRNESQFLTPTEPRDVRQMDIALGDAVRWELIDRNPIDASRAPRVERKQVQWLRPQEARTLFEKTAEHPLHALWVLLATAGLRIGEALAVQWSDFDPDSQTLRIRRAVQRQPGEGLVFVDTKPEKSRRLVYLTNIATNALLGTSRTAGCSATRDWRAVVRDEPHLLHAVWRTR
jgi:integrase